MALNHIPGFLARLLLALLAGLALSGSAAQPAAGSGKPNIVYIMADDLGYGDLACYGAEDIRTPNLDRLARQGARLTDFYANGPVCTPTRCALMTGRYQQRIGGLEWAIYPGVRSMGLPPQEKTITRMLKDAGYATALAGKWHLGYNEENGPNHHGFDRFFGLLSGNHNFFTHRESNEELDLNRDTKSVKQEGYTTHLITRFAVEFIKEMKAKDHPFFLYVAYNAPHWPFQGPDDGHIEISAAKGNWTSGERSTYVKMVVSMDEGIGQTIAWYREFFGSEAVQESKVRE